MRFSGVLVRLSSNASNYSPDGEVIAVRAEAASIRTEPRGSALTPPIVLRRAEDSESALQNALTPGRLRRQRGTQVRIAATGRGTDRPADRPEGLFERFWT